MGVRLNDLVGVLVLVVEWLIDADFVGVRVFVHESSAGEESESWRRRAATPWRQSTPHMSRITATSAGKRAMDRLRAATRSKLQ